MESKGVSVSVSIYQFIFFALLTNVCTAYFKFVEDPTQRKLCQVKQSESVCKQDEKCAWDNMQWLCNEKGYQPDFQHCNEAACPVDGGFSDFSDCSKTCGDGTQTRTCINPTPAFGGKDCEGATSKTCNLKTCPAPPGYTYLRLWVPDHKGPHNCWCFQKVVYRDSSGNEISYSGATFAASTNYYGVTSGYTKSHHFCSGLNPTYPQWSSVQFPTAQSVSSYDFSALTGYGPEWMPVAWTLQGSNDGSTWTDIDKQSDITWAQRETKKISISTSS